ncbi:copper oxidase, partial [Acinetobacter ursingii]
SAMSFFDVRIPNLKMMVVSADGQPVQPVPVDEFRIGAAETYDVIVEPTQTHYQIQAESIDRSGFAIASLQNEMKPAQHTVTMPAARPRAL